MVKVGISRFWSLKAKNGCQIRIQRVEKHTKMSFQKKNFFFENFDQKSDSRLRLQQSQIILVDLIISPIYIFFNSIHFSSLFLPAQNVSSEIYLILLFSKIDVILKFNMIYIHKISLHIYYHYNFQALLNGYLVLITKFYNVTPNWALSCQARGKRFIIDY